MDNPHPSIYLLAVQSLQTQSSNKLTASFSCENLVCLLFFAVAFLGYHYPVSFSTWISMLLEFKA